MHHVFPAQIVGLDHEGLVGGVLVLEYSVAAVAVVEYGEVELRSDVLGGEDVEVVGLLLVAREQGAEVPELGVGVLGVVVRKGAGGEAPGFVGVVEVDPLAALPLEEVVVLHGGARHAQPAGVHVVALEGIVVVAVVERGVGHAHVHLVEILVDRPADDALVLHRIGQGVGLEYPGGLGQYAVLDYLLLLLRQPDGVGARGLAVHPLLGVVLAALLGTQGGVPCLELGPGLRGRVGQVDGVDLVPERGVQQGFQRVAGAEASSRGVGDVAEDLLFLHDQAVGKFEQSGVVGGFGAVGVGFIDHGVAHGIRLLTGSGRKARTAEIHCAGRGEHQHGGREPYS